MAGWRRSKDRERSALSTKSCAASQHVLVTNIGILLSSLLRSIILVWYQPALPTCCASFVQGFRLRLGHIDLTLVDLVFRSHSKGAFLRVLRFECGPSLIWYQERVSKNEMSPHNFSNYMGTQTE